MRTQNKAQLFCVITVVTSLSTPSSAWAQTVQDTTGNCAPGESSSLTPQATDNIDSANQAVASVPPNPFHLTKLPLYKVSADVLLQSGVKKTITTAANFDPTQPNAANDLNAAMSLYVAVTTPNASGLSNGSSNGNTNESSGSNGSNAQVKSNASAGNVGVSGPIKINNGPPLPTNNATYEAYIKANCAGMSLNAKRAFITMIHSDLGARYSGTQNGSLDQTFSAIQGNGVTGQCGPIAEFTQETMKDCGLPDSFVASAMSHNGGPDQGHWVPGFKDPVTGHYIISQYGEQFDTNETRLTDAVAVANAQLGTGSRMSVVDQNGQAHMDRLPTAHFIDDNLENAESLSPDHAHIEANLGTVQNTVTARASAQVPGVKVGVYATAADDVQDHGIGFVAGGVVVGKTSTFNVSDKTQVTANAQAAVGGMILRVTPPGSLDQGLTGTYTHAQGTEDLDLGAQVTHQSTNGNKLTVGVTGHGDGSFGSYIYPPYDVIRITAEDSPNKTATIHVASVYNIVGKTAETTDLKLQHDYDSAGVKIQGTVKSVKVSNDTTVYALNGVDNAEGLGVRDQASASKTVGKTQFTVSNDVTLVKNNNSTNSYWSQSATDLVKIDASRDTKLGNFQLGVSARANQEQSGDEFNNPGEQVDPAQHPARLGVSLVWTSKTPSQPQ